MIPTLCPECKKEVRISEGGTEMEWDADGVTERTVGDFHKSWVCPFCYPDIYQQQFGGAGTLFFKDNESAAVKCEFWQSESGLRGTLTHAEGHPSWHPILSEHTAGPYRLVMSDGLKLQVIFENLNGHIRAEIEASYTPNMLRAG